MKDLFADTVTICPGMILLPGYVDTAALRPHLEQLLLEAPLRRMITSRGQSMSVETSNCGTLGWISDRRGYRYVSEDPATGNAWPAMPAPFSTLASEAALSAGFTDFEPDSCLINHYTPGTQMGAHQDRDERCFNQPIVSVSMGIDGRFFVTGAQRTGASTAVDLHDGDVLVFGGAARLHYHGVRKLKPGTHPLFGSSRWNLTFRRAG